MNMVIGQRPPAVDQPDVDLLMYCRVVEHDHDLWAEHISDDAMDDDPAFRLKVEALMFSWESALREVEALTPRTVQGALAKWSVAQRYAAWSSSGDGRAATLLATSADAIGRLFSETTDQVKASPRYSRSMIARLFG